MTQIESNPASSAARQMRASVSPMSASPPGHVKDEICSPTFTGLFEQVHPGGHYDVADDRRIRSIELHATDQHDRLTGRLARGKLGGGTDLIRNCHDGRMQHPAVGVRRAAQVDEWPDARHA